MSSGCLQARIGWYSSTLLLADIFFIFFIFVYLFEQRLSSGEDRLVQLNDIPVELQQRMRAFKGCFSFFSVRFFFRMCEDTQDLCIRERIPRF